MSHKTSEVDPVGQLANEFIDRRRRGESPSIADYVAQHPDLEDRIRQVFPMMLLMEEHAPDVAEGVSRAETEAGGVNLERVGDFRILREVGRGGMGIVYEAVQESLGRHVALKVFPKHSNLNPRHRERFKRESRAAAMLHHTNIVPVFAVGEEDGMLYYAMQFIPGAGLDEVIDELQRLNQLDKTPRAQPAARGISQILLSGHATIEPKHNSPGDAHRNEPLSFSQDDESGSNETSDGSFQSSVQLPGQATDSSISETGSQYWHSVARIGVQVAEAIQYAHEQGTLHRDIKPSNLLLDQNATVWVTDFGLAKSLEEDDLTHTGELIGTLRYMPPEQFLGKADARSDIYSLGLTLYELLTLRFAFESSDRNRLIRAITEHEPIRPRKHNPRIPRDLETIVLKAIDRDPFSRYGTADELARDLNCFLNYEPIQARPISTTERVVKWAKRRPAIAGLSAALVVVLLSALATVTWKWRSEQSARKEAEFAGEQLLRERNQARRAEREERLAKTNEATQRARAEALLDDSETNLYYSHIAQADLQLKLNNLGQAATSLRLASPQAGQKDRRGWEWGYLKRLLHPELMSLPGGSGEAPWIRAISFSASGERFATAASAPLKFRQTPPGIQGAAKVWNARTGELVRDFSARQLASVHSVALSTDGRRLATCEYDVVQSSGSFVRLWDVDSGEELWSVLRSSEEKPPLQLQFSPDGSLLAGVVGYLSLVVIDVATGSQKYQKPPEKKRSTFGRSNPRTFEFSDDGKSIIAFGDGSLSPMVEYDAQTGELNSVLKQHNRGPLDPTGAFTANIDDERNVQLRDAKTGKLLREFRHESNVWALAFRPDGKQLATAGADHTVRLWSIPNATPIAVFQGHTSHVISLAFSPVGDRLVSGDWHGVVKVWDVTKRPGHSEVFPRTTHGVVTDLVFDQNGEEITAAYQSCYVRCYCSTWNAVTGLPVLASDTLDLCKTLVARGRPTDPGRHTAFDQSGLRLVGRAESDSQVAKVFSVADYEELQTLSGLQQPIHHVTISADGRWAAATAVSPQTLDQPGEIKVWNTETANERWSRPYPGLRDAVTALSPNGDLLAVARESLLEGQQSERFLEVWDLPGQKRLQQVPLKSNVSAMEFDPTGKVFACADQEHVRILDSSTAEVLHRMEIVKRIDDLAFNPAGNRLAGATRSGTFVWDALTGHAVITLRSPPTSGDPAFSPRVVFSHDGMRLAATQANGAAHIWDSAELDETALKLRSQVANLRARVQPRGGSRVSPKLVGWWRTAIAGIDRQLEADAGNLNLIAKRIQAGAMLNDHEGVAKDIARVKRQLGASADSFCFSGGGEHITAPHIPFDSYRAFTIEAWIKNWRPTSSQKAIVAYQGHALENGVQLYPNTAVLYNGEPNAEGYRYSSGQSGSVAFGKYDADRWTHLALVFDGATISAFVGGELAGQRELAQIGPFNPKRRFLIGDTAVHESRLRGPGLLGGMRVSKVARYTKSFTPTRDWAPDDDTVMLFDFSRPEGRPQDAHVPDLSGKGNHGEIIDVFESARAE